MKKIVWIAAVLALLIAVFTGCSPKLVGKYPPSEVYKLREKTNALDDYQVKFSLKQSMTLRNTADSSEPVIWESLYQISDGVFKKHKTDSYNQYLFTGKQTFHRTGEYEHTVRSFKKYNDDKKMYVYFGDTLFDEDDFTDGEYLKADKLSTYYYEEDYIDVIYEWQKSFGKKSYVFEYDYSTSSSNAQRLFREPDGYYLPGGDYTVKQCKMEMILDKKGYLSKQIVDISFGIRNAYGTGYSEAAGDATMHIEIEYVKPGKTVKI